MEKWGQESVASVGKYCALSSTTFCLNKADNLGLYHMLHLSVGKAGFDWSEDKAQGGAEY